MTAKAPDEYGGLLVPPEAIEQMKNRLKLEIWWGNLGIVEQMRLTGLALRARSGDQDAAAERIAILDVAFAEMGISTCPNESKK